MGIVRSLWFVTTVVIAGPAALIGILQVLDGEYVAAALFLGLALVLVGVSEYIYLRLTDRTVGRLKRLVASHGDGKSGK